jgi:RimJ/RimL family protein N-acetyltransferase
MISGSKIKLRKKRLADAPDDYAWHADPELAALDAAPLPKISYPRYLADYTSEMRYPTPNRQRFAIETLDGTHVGNCTYYGIDETKSEAELGIIIGNRDYWNQGYGTDAITTLVNHIFQQTKLNRIYLKTLETNARAQRCFEKCGFAPYGHLKRDGYNFVLMELNREEWEKQQD